MKQISCIACGKLYIKSQFTYVNNEEVKVINQENVDTVEDEDLIDLSEKNLKKSNENVDTNSQVKLAKGKNLICSVCIQDVK
jgi:phage FluMu protein Com